jgi:hypothetical protein
VVGRKVEALVLVYDLTTGPLQTVIEVVRKVLYINGCPLCDTTHGARREKPEWTSCREALGVEVKYFHKDGLPAELSQVVGSATPCILARLEHGEIVRLVEPTAIRRCRGSVRDLRGKIDFHLASKGLRLR